MFQLILLLNSIVFSAALTVQQSPCLESQNALFSVINDAASYEIHKNNCVLNGLGTLARVSNKETNSFIIQFIAGTIAANKEAVWLGMEDTKHTLSGSEPLRFDYVDGSLDSKAFFQNPFQTPWNLNEPNNFQGKGQFCVRYLPSTQEWDDEICTIEYPALCRKECTTSSPTDSPSQSPSFSPTATPSDSPTLSPTFSPTFVPTVSPTTSPTVFGACNFKKLGINRKLSKIGQN